MPLLLLLSPKFALINIIIVAAVVMLFFVGHQKCHALILSGSPDSFARYPKWAQTFENELSFEFKTRMSNALVLYTDDGAVHQNFFTISLLDGHLLVEFRLGEQQQQLEMPPERRPVIQIAFLNGAPRVDDGHWHRFNFFQAWENVRVQLDEQKAFRVLSQRTFSLGNIRTNSDIFIGGIPKEIEKLSSPLRRHSQRFAGSIRSVVYRLYPQGVSMPQLTDSLGTRKTDEDYCQPLATMAAAASRAAVTKLVLAQSPADGVGTGSYCQNGGRCYSANNGARCDCGDTEYEGRRTEVSFFGNEWLGYDVRRKPPTPTSSEEDISTVSLDGGGDEEDEPQGVWSSRQMFNITFRTNFSNALLLLAGDGRSHVELFLEKGVILARSQLAGSEKRIVRVQDRALRRVHLDDNLWHTVTLIRELSMKTSLLKNAVFSMRLIVDDFFNQEVRQFSTALRLGNAFLFLGGAPAGLANQLVPDNLFPFRGCIKKAFFQSGPIKLNLIALADQGFGQSHVQTFGDLSFSCSSNAQVPEVFAFNSGKNFTKLPAWNSPSRGTLGFSMIINLGSGHIRLQASAKALNDGQWHSVVMERNGRRGFLSVDTVRTDFSCPGRSANLNIEEPIFLGGVQWESPFLARKKLPEAVTVIQLTVDGDGTERQTAQRHPSTVWTIGLQTGFVGCLKNVRVNGINAQIAHAFREAAQLSSEIIRHHRGKDEGALSAGCPFSFTTDYCARVASPRGATASGPCRNGGICWNAHNAHRCDCTNTTFEGPNCAHKPRPVQFLLAHFDAATSASRLTSAGWHSEAEDILVKFRLLPPGGWSADETAANVGTGTGGGSLLVLLDTLSGNQERPKGRLLLAVLGGTVAAAGGMLVDWVFAGGEEKTLHWAHNTSAGNSNISDGNWHSAQVRRRGRNVGLFIDGHWSHHQLNVQNPVISIDELAVGEPIGPNRLKNQLSHLVRFNGDLRHFTLNGFDLLKKLRPTSDAFGGSEKDTERHNGGTIQRQGTEIIGTPTQMVDMRSTMMTVDYDGMAAKDGLFSTSTAVLPPKKHLLHHHHHYHHQKHQQHQQQQFVANDSSAFFTKAPLGCLRHSEQQRSCEPEPIAEDGFFTPVLPKPLRKSASAATTSTAATSSSSTPTPAKVKTATTKTSAAERHGIITFPRRTTKVPSSSLTATTAQQKQTAPHLTRRPPTFAHQSTPASARFSVGPNDPTLYAVRPTTPMNGGIPATTTTSSTPPLSSMDTANNQLGDDKKLLIGVGSLSIVVMVGAILLCVFCKRCNSLCSQLANAAGAGGGGGGAQMATGGAGLKAGYAPIPPNEFASPQLQHHHAMATFEQRNGHQGALPPSSLTLRNGAGIPLGNGVAATAGGGGIEQQRQTRVVLANGSGSAGGGGRIAHETTSLINAAAAPVPSLATTTTAAATRSAAAGASAVGAQQQQSRTTRAGDDAARKRDFKEWYV